MKLATALKWGMAILATVFLYSSWTATHIVTAQGKIWHVATSGSDVSGNGSESAPFATIQHGVEEARNNDIVLVHPGTYFENVHVWGGAPPQPQTVIKSLAGPTVTVIDGRNLDSVITVEAGTVTVEGFTIQNGGGSGLASAGYGVVVYPYWETNLVTIRNNVIKNNRGQGGIGIRGGSQTLIENNLIVSNTASLYTAGGIHLDVPSGMGWSIIRNNVIAHNQGYAGGLKLTACCGVTLHIDVINNTIVSNTATGYGGGIDLSAAASTRLANNIIVMNTASYAGNDLYGTPTGAVIEFNDIGDGQLAGISGNFSSPPLLADPTNGDYHLTANSACINAGTAIGAPTVDFEGNPRPYGSGFDVGADEFIWSPDGLPPASNATSPFIGDQTFIVSWQGTDQGGSGIAYYDVQVKDGSHGSWTDWLTHTHNLQATYDGAIGHTYLFQSRAVDHAGNIEPYPGGSGDTSTFVGPNLGSSMVYADLSDSELLEGSIITYTIVVRNTQAIDASAGLTDTLPTFTRYVTDSITSSAEPAIYAPNQGDNGSILWNGVVSLATPVTVTFEVELLPDAPANLPIRNTAFINDGWGHVLTRLVFAPSHDIYLPLVMKIF